MLTAYAAHLILAGVRPSTSTARLSCLLLFARTIAPRELTDATRWDCESFLARPLKPESRRAYRSHLRQLYRWMLDEGFIDTDPTDRLPPVRIPRSTPRPVAHADLLHALEHADPRMRAWLLLMALAGLRCIEVSALHPEDLVASDAGPLLHLRECKGGGTATMPAHPSIVAALSTLPVRDGVWWACSRTTVSAKVSEYLRSVDVPATAHQLRHYAGSSWFRASEHDLMATSTLMRHASVRSTQGYVATDPQRPMEIVRRVQLVAS